MLWDLDKSFRCITLEQIDNMKLKNLNFKTHICNEIFHDEIFDT